jgi:hypothetical protein
MDDVGLTGVAELPGVGLLGEAEHLLQRREIVVRTQPPDLVLEFEEEAFDQERVVY